LCCLRFVICTDWLPVLSTGSTFLLVLSLVVACFHFLCVLWIVLCHVWGVVCHRKKFEVDSSLSLGLLLGLVLVALTLTPNTSSLYLIISNLNYLTPFPSLPYSGMWGSLHSGSSAHVHVYANPGLMRLSYCYPRQHQTSQVSTKSS
jgi:hypothetical protein